MKNLILPKIATDWKTHAQIWIFYYVLTYIINVIGTPEASLMGFSIMFTIFILTFYFLVFITGRWSIASDQIKLAGIILLVFCITLFLLYLLVYHWLPNWGVHIANRNRDFSTGKFIQETFRSFQPALLGALAFRLGAENQKRKVERQRIEKEKQEIQHENRYLKVTALGKQLESHWIHAIFTSIFAKVANNDKLSNMMQSLLTLLKYYFNNISLKRRVVMLEKEVNHITNLIALNEVAEPDAVPVIWIVEKPLHARQIPPLILGTLVENAFKYADQEDPDGPIRIKLSSTVEQLVFTCENKIASQAQELESHKLGLANVRRQLELIAPGRNELAVRDDGVSFYVSLTINYEIL